MKHRCKDCGKLFTCKGDCYAEEIHQNCHCDPCVKGKPGYIHNCKTKYVLEKPRKGKLIGGYSIQ